MGDLISAIGGSVGGSSAKTDRGNFLKNIGNLQNVFNWGLPQGKASTAAGAGATAGGLGELGQAGRYFSDLTAGNRTAAMQAISPEVASVTSAADAAKRNLAASGTARGGGTAGVNQDVNAATQAKIDEALFGVRPGAAQAEAGIGAKTADIGLGQQQIGLGQAGLAQKAAFDAAEESRLSRMDSAQLHQQAVDRWSKVFDDALSLAVKGFPGLGGGGGPTDTGFGAGVLQGAGMSGTANPMPVYGEGGTYIGGGDLVPPG